MQAHGKITLLYLLKESGGLLLFGCNYDVKDLSINSQFYMELLLSIGGLSSAMISPPKRVGMSLFGTMRQSE